MFFSALLFGYFGFVQLSGNQSILVFQLMVWTLRIAAIGFAASGVLTIMRVRLASPLYLVLSAGSVIMFVVLGVWHFLDPSVGNTNGILLLVFAAFNSWGVWDEIKGILRRRPVRDGGHGGDRP